MRRHVFWASIGCVMLLVVAICACGNTGDVSFIPNGDDDEFEEDVETAPLDGDTNTTLPDGDADSTPCTPHCEDNTPIHCYQDGVEAEAPTWINDCSSYDYDYDMVCSEEGWDAICVPIGNAVCRRQNPLLTTTPEGLEARPLELGPVPFGGHTKQTLVLKNVGSRVLTLSSLDFTPDSSPDFALDALPLTPLTIEPGGEYALVVVYVQRASTASKAVLTIVSDSCAKPQRSIYFGSVIFGQSILNVTPTEMEFGAVDLGMAMRKTLLIKNAVPADCDPSASPRPEKPCNKPLAVWNFKISGPDAASFTIDTSVPVGEAAPMLLSPGGELRVNIDFAPTSGDCHTGYMAELSFDENADVNAYTVLNAPMVVPLKSICK